MNKKLPSLERKHANRMEALKAKAPNSIPYEDCWNLKSALASIIADHLRTFIYWEKHSPYGGVPGPISEKWADPEKGRREWLKILRKMLYAFDSFNPSDSLPPEDTDSEEQQPKNDKEHVREGMQLFVDFYDYLWI